MSRDFLGKAAPPGYIAGLGRGATGFMTRPDLGSNAVAAAPDSRFNSDRSMKMVQDDDEEQQQYENEEGLLAPSGAFGAEDAEADAIFAAVDAKMGERRARQKAKAVASSLKRNSSSSKEEGAAAVFTDLKKDLAKVSMEEWAALPEAGDFRAKRMKKASEKERYTPLPDSIITSGMSRDGYTTTTADEELDFAEMQEAREKVLGVRIDQALGQSESGGGVDAQEYLAMLGSHSRTTDTTGNVKRARALLQSALQSSPHSPQAWIAAARLEESALEVKKARELIQQACAACPDSEDVWMEALRLLPREQSLTITAQALESVPASERLWMAAAGLEEDGLKKIKILQRALERVPGASNLWKALVELEDDEAEARVLLRAAVENCPEDIDLWLALARLEDHEGARKVINKARQAIPKNRTIWLAAARLEEAYENGQLVEKIIARAIDDLQLGPAEWLEAAIECGQTEDHLTAAAIVKQALILALDDLIANADAAIAHGAYRVAKELLLLVLQSENKAEIWLKLVDVCSKIDQAHLEKTWNDAVAACPTSDALWLGYAKHKFQAGDAQAADNILLEAYNHVPSSEAIWIETAKMQSARGRPDLARETLATAREKHGMATEHIFELSARFAATPEEAKGVLVQGLQRFPSSGNMWLHLAQLESETLQIARGVYKKGLESAPSCPNLWIEAAALEASFSDTARARVLLEQGRQHSPSDELLWLESIRLESSTGQTVMAKALLAKALQACPQSGILWAEAVCMEPPQLRKSKANTALARLEGKDPHLHACMAQLLWAERKLEAAKEHFEKAIQADPSNGDAWAFYILFSRKYSTESEQNALMERAFAAQAPQSGLQWGRFRKSQRTLFEQDPRALFLSFVNTLNTPL